MQNYQTKQNNLIEDISTILLRLDKETQQIKKLANDPNSRHDLKLWRAEKRAMHDIKYILHDVHKYNRYEESKSRDLNRTDYNYMGLNQVVAKSYFNELAYNSSI